MFKILNLSISGLTLLLPFSLLAATTDGAQEVNASLNPSCYISVGDVMFGDVSIQTMTGSGVASANSKVKILCTKNQAVELKSNNGLHSAGGGGWELDTNYKIQMAEYDSSTKDIIGGWFDVVNNKNYAAPWSILSPSNVVTYSSFNNYNPDTNKVGNGYGTFSQGVASFTGATQIIVGSRAVSRIVKLDGSFIANGATPPGQEANMVSGLNKIRYELSLSSNFSSTVGSIVGNQVTYNQNNGLEQEFNLYGKAYVNAAPPGIYADTNTFTISF